MPTTDTRNDAILAWVAAAVLTYVTYLIIRPLLVPIAWAAVIAIVFHPVYARLNTSWSSTRAAAATTGLASLVIVVPLSFLATAFVSETLDAVRDMQDALNSGRFVWVERIAERLLQYLPAEQRPALGPAMIDAAQRGAVVIVSYSGSIVANLVTFLFELVVALLASFFFLRDSASILQVIVRIVPLGEPARDQLIRDTGNLIGVSVRSSVIVAALQGLLGGLVFAGVGIDAPVFWGVVMGVLCLLPLGAWVVWLPAAVILVASGAIVRGLIVGILGVALVSAVDNVLRPLLLSGRTAINGLIVFVGLLGGVVALGAIGLVLGPVVLAIASSMLSTYSASRSSQPNQ